MINRVVEFNLRRHGATDDKKIKFTSVLFQLVIQGRVINKLILKLVENELTRIKQGGLLDTK
jgi:hypothetical protein